MSSSLEELYRRAAWDGVKGNSRHKLLNQLQRTWNSLESASFFFFFLIGSQSLFPLPQWYPRDGSTRFWSRLGNTK